MRAAQYSGRWSTAPSAHDDKETDNWEDWRKYYKDQPTKIKLTEAADEQSFPARAKLCRELLEMAVDYIYEKINNQKPKMASLLELIDSTTITSFLNGADIVNSLHYIRILGMNAKHGRSVRKKEAKLAFDNISYAL